MKAFTVKSKGKIKSNNLVRDNSKGISGERIFNGKPYGFAYWSYTLKEAQSYAKSCADSHYARIIRSTVSGGGIKRDKFLVYIRRK